MVYFSVSIFLMYTVVIAYKFINQLYKYIKLDKDLRLTFIINIIVLGIRFLFILLLLVPIILLVIIAS